MVKPYIDNAKSEYLSREQRGAVKHFEGPALVIAGPGSGKTRVIIERVAYLIKGKNISPEKILVTTFTEKAADELKVRLSKSLGKSAELIHISTIHSLCKTLLEDFFTEHNLGAQFDILDEETQKLFINVNRDKLGIWRWNNGWIRKGMNEKDVCELYNFLTRNDVDIEKLKNDLKKKGELVYENEKLISSYSEYLTLMDAEKKIDFENLQLKLYKLICKNKDIIKEIQKRFEYILVDEYQDTSPIQDKILREIAKPKNNIFVVGDENQSIYGFRGASVGNFIYFEKHFGKVKKYYLSTNFRSTQNIVSISNKLLEAKIKKELASRRRKGEKIILIKDETADSVALKTIRLIKMMKEKKIITKYGDVALLFRTKLASEDYIKYLELEEIPYVTFDDGAFITRLEIKTMVYLISYVLQKLCIGDKFKDWCGWWNTDLFKTEVLDFSNKTKQVIDKMDKKTNIHSFKNINELINIGITDKQDAEKIININMLRMDIERLGENAVRKSNTAESISTDINGKNRRSEYSFLEIFYEILKYTGYLRRLLDKNDKESKEKLYNLAKLSEIIGKYEVIFKKFKPENLLWFIYINARDKAFSQYKIENEDTVKVMTIHKAKGLEFPVVFICSMVEGRFPLHFKDESKRYLVQIDRKFCMDDKRIKQDEEEFFNEELRLFYVGITRTQDNLIFTTSDKIRIQKAKKSRFLELIKEHIFEDVAMQLPIEMKYNIVEKIPNLSYSSINTYIDCPFRYMLVYEYGFVTPTIFMQNIGTFVHNVLQRIHKEMKSKNIVNKDKIKMFVDDYWVPVYTRKSKDEKLKLMYFGYFIEYFKNIKDVYDEIIAIEKPFSYIGDNMIIRGKVDLIIKDREGNIKLIDFKARKIKGIKETNVDKQLRMYRYCLGHMHIDKLIAYTFMDNQESPFDFNEKEIEDFLRVMSGDMKNKVYKKNMGTTFCKECQFNFLCGGDDK